MAPVIVGSSPKHSGAAALTGPLARNVNEQTSTTIGCRMPLPCREQHLHGEVHRSSSPAQQHHARPLEPAPMRELGQRAPASVGHHPKKPSIQTLAP
jgi:hypothetical protein